MTLLAVTDSNELDIFYFEVLTKHFLVLLFTSKTVGCNIDWNNPTPLVTVANLVYKLENSEHHEHKYEGHSLNFADDSNFINIMKTNHNPIIIAYSTPAMLEFMKDRRALAETFSFSNKPLEVIHQQIKADLGCLVIVEPIEKLKDMREHYHQMIESDLEIQQEREKRYRMQENERLRREEKERLRREEDERMRMRQENDRRYYRTGGNYRY